MRMAAIYARVSSEQQREANTIASQTASLIEFAQGHDLEVPQEWVFEDDGYSGATLERPGLERGIVLMDGDELRKRADTEVPRAGIDLVADLEAAYGRADLDDGPSDVVTKDEGWTVRQENLELAIPDLGIERIDGCGMDAHEDVGVLNPRILPLGEA